MLFSITSIIIFALLTLSIIFFPSIIVKNKKIGTYWIISLVGAIILLVIAKLPLNELANNLTSDSEINPIKILILFLSMSYLSIVLDELGLFRWAANKAVLIAKNKQISVFLSMYFLIGILTIFTSNDIVILTITPFICMFCKNAKVNPLPYLIAEFAAANTYSMMLLIGNPTNIYLSTAQGITFIEYFKVMAIPTIASGIVEILLILLIFRKSLRQPFNASITEAKIENNLEMIVSLIHLLVCIICLVISNYINISMWMIALASSVSLTICLVIIELFKHNHTLLKSIKRLPYELIPFILGMFTIIVCLDHSGIITKVSAIFSGNDKILSYGLLSYLSSNIINNIPMSMLFSKIISLEQSSSIIKATYASIIGSNIGAFLTPIGALAGIMFTSLTEKYDTKLDFKTFIKYGLIISVPVLLVSLIALEIIL